MLNFAAFGYIHLLICGGVLQNICGMSVVGDDWESFKRYNLAEIYQPTQKPGAEPSSNAENEATPNSVTTNEAKAQPPEADKKPE
jgi:tRNA acetyltransferase TAN1